MLHTEYLREQRHSADAESLKQLMEKRCGSSHYLCLSLSLPPQLSYVVANLIFLNPTHPPPPALCGCHEHQLCVNNTHAKGIIKLSMFSYKIYIFTLIAAMSELSLRSQSYQLIGTIAPSVGQSHVQRKVFAFLNQKTIGWSYEKHIILIQKKRCSLLMDKKMNFLLLEASFHSYSLVTKVSDTFTFCTFFGVAAQYENQQITNILSSIYT